MKLKEKPRAGKGLLFNPYSHMIKILAAPGAVLWYRIKLHRISEKSPKNLKGGVIIASNHNSFNDPVILFYAFWRKRLSFLATKELFGTPINRFFFKNMNCIMVDREKFGVSTLKEACRKLKHDLSVVIFPEGLINCTEDELLRYKAGAAFMATKSGKPVLPVYIANRKRWWERTHVVIGECVDISQICRDIHKKDALNYASEYLYRQELVLAEYYHTYIKEGRKSIGEQENA